MEILIEDYKGQTIYYDDIADKFVCDIEIDGSVKNAKRGSLNDLRKQIDQFVKENLNFKPFKFFYKDYYDYSVMEATAIRTDGKLVVEKPGRGNSSYFGAKESEKMFVFDDKVEAMAIGLNEAREKYLSEYSTNIKNLYSKLEKMDLSKYDLK